MVSTSSVWAPVLERSEGERALSVVHSIADDIWNRFNSGKRGANALPDGADLATGLAGNVLLLWMLGRCLRAEDATRKAYTLLDFVTNIVGSALAEPALYHGVAGIGWIAHHLHNDIGNASLEDPCGEIDMFLADVVRTQDLPIDLIHGSTGVGIYALERLPRSAAVATVESIISQLDMQSSGNAESLTWHKSPAELPSEMRERYPNGLEAIGMAHGIAGVVGFLSRAYAAGFRGRTEPLLRGAMSRLTDCKNPDNGRYPSRIHLEDRDGENQDSWCWGQLGIASAFLSAGKALRQDDLFREGVRIGLELCARATSTLLDDGSLCHGTAGTAHVLSRFHHTTGASAFVNAARLKFRDLMDRQRGTNGIGGYEFVIDRSENGPSWGESIGFLTGSAGVGLALLAAATPHTPCWDRLLLLDFDSV